jgi:hypothetical protein
MNTPEAIRTDKLLLVEGQDEKNFCGKLLSALKIKNVQIINAEGQSRFRGLVPAVTAATGFDRVRCLGFVRDAEKSTALSSFQGILSIIRDRTGFPLPCLPGRVKSENGYKTGIFIMPDNSSPGMLENLCLSSVRGSPLADAAAGYIRIAEQLLDTGRKEKFNERKAEVQAYLAGCVPIAGSCGIGAEKGYWDFSSPVFTAIKNFLASLYG